MTSALLPLMQGTAAAQPVEGHGGSNSIFTTNSITWIDVFSQGKEGYHTYRIPAVLRTTKGTVLALAEGRRGRSDQSVNKLVLKRSEDGGRTWGALETIGDDGERSLNNPCIVQERQTGKILLMYQSYPVHIGEFSAELGTGWEGDRVVRSYVLESTDEGKTWLAPRDVTRMVKRPKGVNTQASGPGIGIQIRHGSKAGRLIIPFNQGPPNLWNVYMAYSDDQGQTWHMGDVAPGGIVKKADGKESSIINEVQVVELKDGVLRLNARSMGKPQLRKTSLSRDGGETWSKVEDVPDLPEPGCMASIIRVDDVPKGWPECILYSGPIGGDRTNGMIVASLDDGRTWPLRATLCPGRFAYSSLVDLGGGWAGCLFEQGTKDPYERITFARFQWTSLVPRQPDGANR